MGWGRPAASTVTNGIPMPSRRRRSRCEKRSISAGVRREPRLTVIAVPRDASWQRDRLVDEDRVLARFHRGVRGIDVHDRRLAANGARQNGHPDEARGQGGRGDRVDRLEPTLEPCVPGLHDAPVSSGNADLELAGDQATDAAALVAVWQRLAAWSEVDAI